MEEDGVEGAQIVADAATGALRLVDAGAHRLQGDLALLDPSKHASGCGSSLGDAGWDIFWTLNTTGDKDAFGHRRYRVQLGMLLDIPAIGAAGDAEQLGNLLGVVARFQTAG